MRLPPMQNLHLLKADMEKKNWVIDSFRFRYKRNKYIVLVILFEPDEPREQFALLKLDFLREDNFNIHLKVSANAGGLMLEVQTLRLFFGIKYASNIGDILYQFSTELGYSIPTSVNSTKSVIEKKAMVYDLSRRDKEDPDKIYCYAVKRNPITKETQRQQMRTDYNDNKARILRPSLYKKLGKDRTISFCFSDDPNKNYSDEVIIRNWISRQESF